MRVYQTEEDFKGDGRPCSAIREDLKYCVLHSDCVLKVFFFFRSFLYFGNNYRFLVIFMNRTKQTQKNV